MSPLQDARWHVLKVAAELAVRHGFCSLHPAPISAAAALEEALVRRLFPRADDIARALLSSALAADEWAHDAALGRGRDLVADPLGAALAALSLLSAGLREPPVRLPGWRLAAMCLTERVSDPVLREMARRGGDRARARLCAVLEEIAAVHPPRVPLEPGALADMAVAALESGSGREPSVASEVEVQAQRISVLRGCIKALFDEGPEPSPVPEAS